MGVVFDEVVGSVEGEPRPPAPGEAVRTSSTPEPEPEKVCHILHRLARREERLRAD